MIVPITMDKLEVMQKMAQKTYADTFGDHNTEENMQRYFDEVLNLEILREEMLNPLSQHFFILVDGKEAGYLKVNVGEAQTEHDLEDAFEVQRIYVLKEYQGLGLGKKLLEHAIELAKQTDLTWMWLGVWEHNYKAQKFYSKFGFEKFSEHEFPTGDSIDIDWMLRKKIER